VLGAGAAIGLIPLALFSSGGVQPYSFGSMRDFVALTVFVLLVVPASDRVVRVGAVLTIGLLVIAYVVPTPIGSNVLRLPLLFAIPVVASCVPWRSWALAAALAGMFWWRPPLVSSDVVHAGAAETRASFYQPLLTDLARLGPIGRVEVVPLRDHWESVYVAQAVPLARGWLRQTDVARNLLFYQSTPLTSTERGCARTRSSTLRLRPVHSIRPVVVRRPSYTATRAICARSGVVVPGRCTGSSSRSRSFRART
jgi:hypothetical protein